MEGIEAQTPQVEHSQGEKWYTPLTCVTPLSKAFAVGLFILLPFVGFVVGVGWGKDVSLQKGNVPTGDLFKSDVLPDDEHADNNADMLWVEHEVCDVRTINEKPRVKIKYPASLDFAVREYPIAKPPVPPEGTCVYVANDGTYFTPQSERDNPNVYAINYSDDLQYLFYLEVASSTRGSTISLNLVDTVRGEHQVLESIVYPFANDKFSFSFAFLKSPYVHDGMLTYSWYAPGTDFVTLQGALDRDPRINDNVWKASLGIQTEEKTRTLTDGIASINEVASEQSLEPTQYFYQYTFSVQGMRESLTITPDGAWEYMNDLPGHKSPKTGSGTLDREEQEHVQRLISTVASRKLAITQRDERSLLCDSSVAWVYGVDEKRTEFRSPCVGEQTDETRLVLDALYEVHGLILDVVVDSDQ